MEQQRTPTKQVPDGTSAGMETEQNVYTDVYRLLIAGMIATNALFLIGQVLALIHPQFFPLSTNWVRQQYRWNIISHGLVSGDPTAFVMIATGLLILTPVARVVVSIYAFYVDGDLKYVAVTSTVLFIIVMTVVLGLLGLK